MKGSIEYSGDIKLYQFWVMLLLNVRQSEFKVTAQCFQLYIINYNMSEIAFLYVKNKYIS